MANITLDFLPWPGENGRNAGRNLETSNRYPNTAFMKPGSGTQSGGATPGRLQCASRGAALAWQGFTLIESNVNFIAGALLGPYVGKNLGNVKLDTRATL
jgi:hypothetical protein